MAEKRKVVLTKLANEHISRIHQFFIDEKDEVFAAELMDDFLDVVFGAIARFPEQFPVCIGIRSNSPDYRIASMKGDFRVIYQILKDKILILMIIHESELPF